MSLQLVVAPSKIINQDIPEESRWSAANRQPVIWKFLRRDCEITNIAYNAGSPAGLEITVTGNVTTEVDAGDTVYVNGSNGEVEGDFIVIDVTLSGGNTIITIDTADQSPYSAMTGYLNLIQGRTFYRMEVKIYGYLNGTYQVLNPNNYALFRPDSTGLIKANIQQFVRTALSMASTYNYSNRTQAEYNFGQRYDIQTREFWKEQTAEQAFFSGHALNEHYICNSVRQIGQVYGNNMAEYVMLPTDQSSPQYEHSKGKFLTMFDMPKYWPGYPFSLGFIYDAAIRDASQRLAIVEDRLNSAGGSITVTEDLIDELPETVNHSLLRETWDPINSVYSNATKKLLYYLKAVTLTNLSDANLIWDIGQNYNGDIQAVDFTSGVSIGNANWSTNMNQLMIDLVNSINTNAASGPLIDNTYPFDNSQGYTATKATGKIHIYYSAGVGLPFNVGENIYGGTSGATAIIVSNDMTIGMIVIDSVVGAFTPGEFIISNDRVNVYCTGDIVNQPYDITINAPVGTGSSYNGVTIGFIVGGGQWFIFPAAGSDFSQAFSNGVDQGLTNATGLTTARVSEIKTIEIDHECKDNMIYLRWYNPNGYWDYWMFEYNYISSDSINNEETFERYVEDVGDAEARRETISKDVQEEIVIRAEHLTKQQCEGLRYLLSSVHVQRYLPNGSGFTWMTCRVKPGTFQISEARLATGYCELTLLPPERYNQQQ